MWEASTRKENAAFFFSPRKRNRIFCPDSFCLRWIFKIWVEYIPFGDTLSNHLRVFVYKTQDQTSPKNNYKTMSSLIVQSWSSQISNLTYSPDHKKQIRYGKIDSQGENQLAPHQLYPVERWFLNGVLIFNNLFKNSFR